MTRPACCAWHTNTCGHLDVCCDQCPSQRESVAGQYAAVLASVLFLVLWAVGLG